MAFLFFWFIAIGLLLDYEINLELFGRHRTGSSYLDNDTTSSVAFATVDISRYRSYLIYNQFIVNLTGYTYNRLTAYLSIFLYPINTRIRPFDKDLQKLV